MERASRQNIQNGRSSLLYLPALRHWRFRQENKLEGKGLEIFWKGVLRDFSGCGKREEGPDQSRSLKKYER